MRNLPRKFYVAAALYLFFAWSKHDFFFPDEHFQLLEFMMHKFFGSAGGDLPWEFTARMRPWLQPAAYGLIARAAAFIGVNDRLVWLSVFQTFSAVSGAASLAVALRLNKLWVRSPGIARFIEWLLCFAWFLPCLQSRYSSECLGGQFFLLGLGALFLGERKPKRVFAAAVLFGLSFQFRYQCAFFLVGLGAWLWLVGSLRARPWLALIAGFCAVLTVGAIVDSWGYGQFTAAPWNYFRENILFHKAADMSVSPWSAYFDLTYRAMTRPLGLAVNLGLILSWCLAPGHPLTWATAAFFWGHTLVGHKELRFLFPLALPAILSLGVALDRLSTLLPTRVRPFSGLYKAFGAALIIWNVSLIAACWLKPLDVEILFDQRLYSRFKNELHLVDADGDPLVFAGLLKINYYRPKAYAWSQVPPPNMPPQRSFFEVVREAWDRPRLRTGCSFVMGSLPDAALKANFSNWENLDREFRLYECAPST